MERHLNNFRKYLIQKGHTTSTIKGYILLLRNFFTWCNNNDVSPKKATLDELYDYQSFNRNNGDKPRTMQAKISILKEYYRFTKRKNNPALLMRTEKPEIKLPKNLLNDDTLTNLYLDYVATDNIHTRNKVMFGLFIFQGLTRGEIELLEVQHIELDKNRIYVPQTVLTNRRYLKLNPIQKRDLQQYINQVRPELIADYNKSTSRLFFSTRSGMLTDVHNQMLKFLKPKKVELVSFQQLRFSRISLWVNKLGLREAQYRSGLKNVTSLIRYRSTDKEKLKQKLSIVHPMERLKLAG
jgi:integrase/recombinase XerD